MNAENMVSYSLPFGWEVSFPDHWMYEECVTEGHSEWIFWPESCEPTVRMSCLHVEKGGKPIPAAVLKTVMKLVFLGKKKLPNDPIQGENIKSFGYESNYLENGVSVSCLGVVSCAKGNALIIGIYSTDKEKCKEALQYVKRLRFNRK